LSHEPLDCVACGACCFGGHDRYIQLFPEDLGRGLPAHAVVALGGETYMRMEAGHCAQLMPLPGGGLACAVYAARPTACRAFRAGSFECGRSRHHRLAQADAMRLPLVAIVEVLQPGTPANFPDVPSEDPFAA
jgi:uncharacterized protein